MKPAVQIKDISVNEVNKNFFPKELDNLHNLAYTSSKHQAVIILTEALRTARIVVIRHGRPKRHSNLYYLSQRIKKSTTAINYYKEHTLEVIVNLL